MIRVFWPRVEAIFDKSVQRNDLGVLVRFASHASSVARECERTAKLVKDAAGRQSFMRQTIDAHFAAKSYRTAAIRRSFYPSPWHLRIIV